MPWGNMGTVWAEVGLDLSGLEQGVKQAQKQVEQLDRSLVQQVQRMGENIQKLGQTLSVGISLPVSAAGGAVLRMAMDVVESGNLFQVSMGRMANAARAWSQELRKQLGLNEYDLRRNIGTFNAMFKAMDFGEEAAFEMSKGLVQLAYDMASFYNLRPDEAFDKLRAAISGEVEPLKRLGIVVNETTIQTWALNNGLVTQGEELSEQQKVVARYNVILEQTKLAQGDLARTLDSPRNMLRMFGERIKQAGVTVGTAFLPSLENALKVVERALGQLEDLVDWFSQLPQPVKDAVFQLGVFAAALGPIMLAVGNLLHVLSGPAGLILVLGALVAGVTAWSNILTDVGGKLDRITAKSKSEVQERQRQATETRKQAEELETLMKRYEELQGKANRTKDEEQELHDVMQRIRDISPDLVTAFNEQGEAMSISSDKARAYATQLWHNVEEQKKAVVAALKLERSELEKEVASEEQIAENVRLIEANLAHTWEWQRSPLADQWRPAGRDKYGARYEFWGEAAEIVKREVDKYLNQVTLARARINEIDADIADILNNPDWPYPKGKKPSPGSSTGTNTVVTTGTKVAKDLKNVSDELSGAVEEFNQLHTRIKQLPDSYGALKAKFADVAEGLKSTDPIIKALAERQAADLVGTFEDALYEASTRMPGAVEDIAKAIPETLESSSPMFREAADAVSVYVKSSFGQVTKAIGEQENELSKALEDFRARVALGELAPEEQIQELERIRDAYAKTESEKRQIDVQIHTLEEDLRQKRVRSAYDEYQFKSQLYDYTAKDHVTHLETLLRNEELTAEERKRLEEELALWRKRLQDEEIEYKKQVEDAWNEYYLASGRKARADLLREEVARREEELRIAKETGVGIELAEANLALARQALNEQLRQDEEDLFRFRVQTGALTTQEQLEQIRAWLAAEQEGSERWRALKLEERNLLRTLRAEEAEANVAGIRIEGADREQLVAYRDDLIRAYQYAVAMGDEGSEAARIYMQKLQEVTEALTDLDAELAKVVDNQTRWNYEQGKMSGEEYLEYLRNLQRGMAQFSDEWMAIQREIDRVTAEMEDSASKTQVLKAQVVVEGAEDLAQTDLPGAIRELEQWRDVFAAMGSEGEAALKVISDALARLNSDLEQSRAKVDALFREHRDPLAVGLEDLDATVAEMRRQGRAEVEIRDYVERETARLTREYLEQRLGDISSMNEEEVRQAQAVLDGVRATIVARVGAESAAAQEILAIQQDLNAQSVALAERRILNEYEFRKRLGQVTLEEQLRYELDLANAATGSAEARRSAALGLYTTVTELARNATEEQLILIQSILEAELAAVQAREDANEELVRALQASLKAVKDAIAETKNQAETLADSITEYLTDSIAGLIEGTKTAEDIMHDIGNRIKRFFAETIANTIVKTMTNAIAKASGLLDRLSQMLTNFLNTVWESLGPAGWVIAAIGAVMALLNSLSGHVEISHTYQEAEQVTGSANQTIRRQAVAPVSVVFEPGAVQITNPNSIEDIVRQVSEALDRRLRDEDIAFGVGAV